MTQHICYAGILSGTNRFYGYLVDDSLSDKSIVLCWGTITGAVFFKEKTESRKVWKVLNAQIRKYGVHECSLEQKIIDEYRHFAVIQRLRYRSLS